MVLWLLFSACCQTHSAVAKTIELQPNSDWFKVLNGESLNPGDEVILAAGIYTDSRRLVISQRGEKGSPIVIRGASGARVVFKRPDAKQNSINLIGCKHFILRDIEITGGSTGIRIGGNEKTPAKFITLENLHIHHVGAVAVTANFAGETYESLTFRHNHIHHTGGHGEGFYLGSNNAADGSTNGYIFNSVIERNYIHDLRGGSVSQGDGIELKDGCYNNIIRDNVIHDTNYPGIIVYGTDGKAPNVIERNVIWNSGDHGIQAASDAVVRNNVIFDTKGEGIYCRDHQSAVVGGLTIVNNTVLSSSSIRVIAPERFSGTVVVANNAVGGSMRIPQSAEVVVRANVDHVSEVFPSIGSKLRGKADASYMPANDFNGVLRGASADVGAYRFDSAGNPGWKITESFKD